MRLAVIIYRISHWFYTHKLIFASNFFSFLNRLLFGTWMPGSAKIGSNFVAGYGGLGIVIHSNSVIGNNTTIGQNVTIGRNFGDKGVPVIGSYVYIGAGSVIFGEIVIGNNVIIGSNSLVNKSVPANCTVVGNPMRIIVTDREMNYMELDNKS
jgi:serine O-acetyltransferase